MDGIVVPETDTPDAASLRLPEEGSIVVLGDTQRTTWAELTFLGREQNEPARRALIHEVARQERPAFLVHLGDMVEAGGFAANWSYFDELMEPLTSRHIPILPALGNHDRGGNAAEVARNTHSRFPELRSGGYYAIKHRELGLIWLDSNLRGDAGARQGLWLERALAEFDADAAVAGVVLFMHHPAYTNGKNRRASPYVQNVVVPRFFAGRKTLALMSGHVHGYERFLVQRRQFVITAGGGGPRVEYAIGRSAPYEPAYLTNTGEPRPFNYVVLEPTAGGLTFTVKGLRSNSDRDLEILEQFTAQFR
jgi:hypothetical protein